MAICCVNENVTVVRAQTNAQLGFRVVRLEQRIEALERRDK